MDKIKEKRVTIDTMVLAYLIEGYEPLLKEVIAVFNLAKEIKASYLVKGEILAGYQLGDQMGIARYFASMEDKLHKLQYHPFDNQSALYFGALRKKYPKIKPPDCIHLATALATSSEFFITGDKQLKQVTEIPVILLKS